MWIMESVSQTMSEKGCLSKVEILSPTCVSWHQVVTHTQTYGNQSVSLLGRVGKDRTRGKMKHKNNIQQKFILEFTEIQVIALGKEFPPGPGWLNAAV